MSAAGEVKSKGKLETYCLAFFVSARTNKRHHHHHAEPSSSVIELINLKHHRYSSASSCGTKAYPIATGDPWESTPVKLSSCPKYPAEGFVWAPSVEKTNFPPLYRLCGFSCRGHDEYTHTLTCHVHKKIFLPNDSDDLRSKNNCKPSKFACEM